MSVLRCRLGGIAIFALLTLIGMSLGTQWLASQLRYSSSLGDKLLTWNRTGIYPPWILFVWAQELNDPVTSTLVKRALFFPLGGAICGFLFLLLGSLVFPLKRQAKHIYGDSSWASLKDVKRAGLLKGEGVFLGALPDGRYLRHEGPEHYAVIAPTRSGKGAGIVVPTLLTWKGSTIIYDLKEENYRVTAGERAKFSDIIYFNPKSLKSAHFNPLLEVRPGITEVRDVQNIANMIIEPEKPGAFDHWIRTGNSLLVATILHILYTAPNGEKNLAGVTSFLSQATQSLTETLHEMMSTPHIRDESGNPLHPHPHIQEAVRDVLNKSADDRSSVHSTVMGYLSLYRDPLLAHVTRDSDFSITDLVSGERPKSLYLVIPPADILRLRPIIRLIINQICRRLTEELPGENEIKRLHRLLLMMDEFTAPGRLEFFESALSFLAGYGIKAMLICQSMNQLKATYGERTSILDNTHVKVFYTPETIETAEYISKSLGQTTVSFRTRGESGQKGNPYFSSKSATDHFAPRALLTPREVLDIPHDESLVFIGGTRPIRGKKIRYFEDGSFIPRVLTPPKDLPSASDEKTKEENIWFTKYGDGVLYKDIDPSLDQLITSEVIGPEELILEEGDIPLAETKSKSAGDEIV